MSTAKNPTVKVGSEIVISEVTNVNSPALALEGQKVKVIMANHPFIMVKAETDEPIKFIADGRDGVRFYIYDRKHIADDKQAALDYEIKEFEKAKAIKLEEIRKYRDFASDEAYNKSVSLTTLSANLVELGVEVRPNTNESTEVKTNTTESAE